MKDNELKSSLHALIDRIQDRAVLQAYLVLLAREVRQESDFWDTLDDSTKSAIQQGTLDVEQGRKTEFFSYMKSQYGV
jgi:hypothetical protein